MNATHLVCPLSTPRRLRWQVWLLAALWLCALLGAPPAQAALVAEYRFEESSYNGTAGEVVDASGNARHGRTLGATSSASGRTCRGLSVGTNTSSSALAMDTGIALPGTVGGTGSISFWYFSDSTDASDRVLLDATMASNARFMLYRNDDSASPSTIDVDLGFVVNSASGAEHAIFKNDAMSDGAWWHITVTWKLVLGSGASRIRTYVNGSLMSEASFSIATAGLAGGIGTLYLGDNRSSATSVQNAARGRFDTVRIYNHELTTPEIEADRSASPACNLLHHLELTSSSAAPLAGSTETFTVKACADASCSSLYTAGVTGNLTASGAGMSVSYPAGAAFSIGPGGSTTVQATVSPSGSVTMGLSSVSPAPVTSPAVYCGMGTAASAGGSCTYTTFADGQPMAAGQRISLESFALPGNFVRHFSPFASLSPLSGSSSLSARQDASFILRPGLADSNCWSFESANQPGWYLRHSFFRLKLDPYSASSPYPQDATFCKRAGLADTSKVSFESLNYPGYYIRSHSDLTVGIQQPNGGDFNSRATFIPQPSWLDLPAQRLARYRLEDSAWTGAAGELTDSGGHASGPFAGRAQGSPLPSPLTSTPARAGSPGTCGYAHLPGPDAGGGSFVVNGLPLSTSAGARSSIAFWMRWTGGSSDVPIGFHHLNLGIWGGTFGFATNSGDNFGIASGALLNTWVHVVAVFNNGSIGGNKLYINGVQQSLSQRIGSPDLNRSTVGSTLYLGAYGDRTTDRFGGQLDEVQVFQGELTSGEVATLYNETHACPASLNHVRIEHSSGSGLTCQPDTLTLRACLDAGCTTPYTGGLSGTLSASGGTVNWPSGAAFSIPAGSSTTTVAIQQTAVGSTSLSASGLSVTAASGSSCNFGSPSCTLTAADAGFLFDVPDQLAETRVRFMVNAVRKSDNSLACTPAFANVVKAVNFKCSYNDPATGTVPVRLRGVALNGSGSTTAACDGTGQAVNLSFDATGAAVAFLYYADVGRLTLSATYTGSGAEAGLSMAGSDSFRVAPFDFAISGVSGSLVAAGSPTSINVTARNYAGVATPNFGREAVPESVSLGFVRAAPTGPGAVSGTLSGSVGSFSAGVATASNLSYSEVGRIDIVATLASTGYLGTSYRTAGSSHGAMVFCADEDETCNLPAGTLNTVWYAAYVNGTGHVHTGLGGAVSCSSASLGDPSPGYYKACWYVSTSGVSSANGGALGLRPHRFELSATAACVPGAFTYAGQPYGLSVTARNAVGATTLNYDGSALTSPNFAQTVTLSDVQGLGLGTLSGHTLAASAFAAGVATASPTYTFTSKQTAPQSLVLRATDGQGTSSAGGTEPAMALRSGRLRLANAFGRANTTLQVPVLAEHWQNGVWQVNAADSCTTVPAASVVLSNPRDALGQASAASTSVLGGPLALSAGRATLQLAAPSPAGQTLSVDLALNLGSATTDNSCQALHPASTGGLRPWLRSRQGSCSNAWDRDPAARATFGIYSPEARKLVHIRDLF